MFESLPKTTDEFKTWTWTQIAPYYDDLLARPLTAWTVEQWLLDWTRIGALIDELNSRYTIATTVNTADTQSEEQFRRYLDEIMPAASAAEQKVKQKLLDSRLEPAGFEIPLRNLRGEAAIYSDANTTLLAEVRKQAMEYDQIVGAQTVLWEGEEIPLVRLAAVLEDPDANRREKAWRTRMARIVQDGPAYADVWKRMVQTRQQIARNAGFSSFREYRWQQMHRFDYTPADAKQFDQTIADVVVPVVSRLAEQRRQQLGLPSLHHWDLMVNPTRTPRLKPYQTIEQLESGISRAIRHLDPELARYFDWMRAEKLFDLETRKNKAPGGYQLELSVARRPFIYMNAVGIHQDIVTLLHEAGHAFHTFECEPLRYLQQHQEQMVPTEFAEVASMSMELLGMKYLGKDQGGFYTDAELAYVQRKQLEEMIFFWPYMAMIDSLQHWVYEHEDEAADLSACDDYWETLTDRYWPYLDWPGLREEKRALWHRQSHVFQDPFYYMEYGIAQMGALQVWANAQKDEAGTVAAYRRALALGSTAPLPDLFTAANIRFAFDAETLSSLIALAEEKLAELDTRIASG